MNARRIYCHHGNSVWDRTFLRRVAIDCSALSLALTAMARPVTMPPSKLSGVRLSIDLLEECDKAIRERGLTKREFFERALRRELEIGALSSEMASQETLDIDVTRKECA